MEQNQTVERPIEIMNCLIVNTQLGFDGGTMLGSLQLKSKSIGVTFGGYVLHVPGNPHPEYDTAFGMDYIAAILSTVGVQLWEQLEGKACRMAIQGNQILGIGNLIEDAWFYPRDLGEAANAKSTEQKAALDFYRAHLAAEAAPTPDSETPKADAGEGIATAAGSDMPGDEVMLAEAENLETKPE